MNRQGSAGDEDNDALDDVAYVLDRVQASFRDSQVQVVAIGLGVRRFSYHDNGVREVVRLHVIRRRTYVVYDLRVWIDAFLHRLEDGGSGCEIVAAESFPFDRPTAALVT